MANQALANGDSVVAPRREQMDSEGSEPSLALLKPKDSFRQLHLTCPTLFHMKSSHGPHVCCLDKDLFSHGDCLIFFCSHPIYDLPLFSQVYLFSSSVPSRRQGSREESHCLESLKPGFSRKFNSIPLVEMARLYNRTMRISYILCEF